MPAEQWYGWMRRDRRHKWQRVCGPCTTMAECAKRLGEIARAQGVLDRHCWMTTGDEPREGGGKQGEASQ